MIGIQRSIHHLRQDEQSFAGTRTFALIAMVGYLSAKLNQQFSGIALISAILAGALILTAYYFKVTQEEGYGTTTHFTAIATYLLGMLVSLGQEHYATFIAVLIIIILEIKPKLQRFEAHITPADINAAVLLLAMTFLVLPVLPDRMVGPYQLFNPYKTWLMAVIISAISFIGYAAIKLLGHQKGLFLTGALGGLASSTGVTVSMSRLAAVQKGYTSHFASAIAIACTFMFLRVIVLVFIVNPFLAKQLLIPFIAATSGGLIYTWYLYRSSKSADIPLEDSFAKNPLQLSEAVKFGILFGIVYGAVNFVQTRYGDIGVYLVSMLSGITDVDAVTLTMAQLQIDEKLSSVAAINGIFIASIVNSLVKLGIASWMGGKEIGWQLAKYFIVTLGLLGMAIWLQML